MAFNQPTAGGDFGGGGGDGGMGGGDMGGGDRGGFGGDRGRGGRGGDRGRRGRRRGRRGPRRGDSEKWVPMTKLGRLVANDVFKYLEEIYLFSLPIKEYQIIDKFIPSSSNRGGPQMMDMDQAQSGPRLQDEVMKIMPVQKQTSAGQRTRFKAFIAVGDGNGHVGLGVKCAKEVAGAIQGAIIAAKLSVVPIRRGWWGNRIGPAHTVPTKLTGKCGSVRMRLIPAPKGTGIVAAIAPKKILMMAGIEDCYTASRGKTRTMGNFIKATYIALAKSYSFLEPSLWEDGEIQNTHPYQYVGAKKEM